jgi:hypothetical protein
MVKQLLRTTCMDGVVGYNGGVPFRWQQVVVPDSDGGALPCEVWGTFTDMVSGV